MRRSSIQTSDLESAILRQIRACERISRVALARDLGLAPSTAGVYVERLIAEGYVRETEEATGETGRPPRSLRLNPLGGEFIGVDFEARNIMAVAVDFSDRPLRNGHKEIAPRDSAEQVIAKLADAIRAVLPPAGSRLLAIGVGVPGTVDSRRGIAINYKFIPQWTNVELARRLSEIFAVPVFLENNARSMALAEMWFGQGKGHEDFLCVSVRNGVGVGMVLNGQLYCGAHHAAGELGRWLYPFLSPQVAPWFAPGTSEGFELQEISSVRALQQALDCAIQQGRRTVLSGRKSPFSVADIVGACQQRDALTLRVIDTAAGALGWALGQLSLTIDPAKVILAGPLTALGEVFLRPLRNRVERVLQLSGTNSPEIVCSTMGEFSGALGAAALALHEWKPVIGKSNSRQPRRKRRA
jgi:N-acetylglucosamine repressor